jgi:methionine biosynthesis protein MetW
VGSSGSSRTSYYSAYVQGLSESSADRIVKLLKVASTVHATRLLDIGCGDGSLSLLLKEATRAKEVYGVEISPSAVKQATIKGLRVKRLDIEKGKLPFGDCFFDLVLCGDLLEHVFDPSEVIVEAKRVLAPSGFLLLTTPNLASWYNRLLLPLGYQPIGTAVSLSCPRVGKVGFRDGLNDWNISGWGGEHLRVMTLRALRDLLRFHGFRVLDVLGACGTVSQMYYARYGFVQWIDQRMCIFPSLATWLVVKAVKL